MTGSVGQHPTLHGNYPNPFNPSTEIRFDLPEASHIRLLIFDARGREVELLVDRKMDPGRKHVRWNAANMPSGLYFYRLEGATARATGAMILTR